MHDRELFDLLEHAGDAAFAVTSDGNICAWNARAEALFGFSRAAAIGRTCFDLFNGRGAFGTLVCGEQCVVRDCAAHHQAAADFDLEVRTRSGRRRWVNISTIVHDPEGGRKRIVHLARDIGARKRTESLAGRILSMSKQLADLSKDAGYPAPVTALSAQERRVLKGLSEGKSAAAIVAELQISPQTLRNHLYRINQKLRTHSRLEAVIHAIRRHLV